MLMGGDIRFRETVASALGWWIGAGVDTDIDEAPRNWLIPPARPGAAATPPAQTAPGTALPGDLAALHDFLATGDYAPGAAPSRQRVAPSGDPASGLMIIADMPDPGDAEAGRLFAGETAKLFDAMLAAMGRTRESIYLSPLSPARLSGGRIDRVMAEPLAALMRRHVALAAPKGVILFGDEPARLLIGDETLSRRGGLHDIQHDSGTVAAIAVPHPRILRQVPARKAATWADMRLLLGVLRS